MASRAGVRAFSRLARSSGRINGLSSSLSKGVAEARIGGARSGLQGSSRRPLSFAVQAARSLQAANFPSCESTISPSVLNVVVKSVSPSSLLEDVGDDDEDGGRI